MESLRIIVVTDFFFPDTAGGANRYAHCAAAGLARGGHRVRVITRRARPGLPSFEHIDGVEVVRAGTGRPHLAKDAAAVVHEVARAARREPEGSIFILNQPLTGLAAMLSGRRRYIYVFHSPWHLEYEIRAEEFPELRRGLPLPFFFRKGARRSLEKTVLGPAEKVVFLSRYMMGLCKRFHGIKESHAVLLPGGVDTSVFSPPEDRAGLRDSLGLPRDRAVLFTLRNLRPRMGIENLLSALKKLDEKGLRPLMLVGGDGPMRGPLEALSVRLGLEKNVRFLGYIPEEELGSYYGAADFFVLPTRELEGFGLVILEALACGTPVLGTPVGGIPEVLEGLGPGLISGSPLPHHLAGAMEPLVKMPFDEKDRYLDLREGCRRHAAENYPLERLIQGWEGLLVETAGRGTK